jgi:polyhydroxyalkanoate synthesis regulator phasin
MIDLFKKAVAAGIGVAVITKEKVQTTLDELVEKGKLSAADAQQLGDRILAEGEAETEKAKVEVNKFFNDLLHKANLVTKEDLAALETRVRDLEGRWSREFPNPGATPGDVDN